jgi:hypothetical protein
LWQNVLTHSKLSKSVVHFLRIPKQLQPTPISCSVSLLHQNWNCRFCTPSTRTKLYQENRGTETGKLH